MRDTDKTQEQLIKELTELRQRFAELERAEEELRESEEKYRSVVERAYDGITIIQDGIMKYINPRLTEIWGGTVQELSDTPFAEHIDPDELPTVVDRYNRRMQGEDVPPIYETVLRRKDGSKAYVELNAGTISYQGRLANLVFVRDITARKQMEEELRKSEEKYRELINGMNDTAWVIDFDGSFIDVNDAAVEVLGYSREELLAMGPHDIDSSLDAETITGLIKGMPTDEIQVFETAHTTKDGKVIPVEINSSLVTYQGKDAILSIARDITERKRMEEELRESEERYRLLFESESDAVMVFDAGTLQFEDANRAALELYGYSKEELLRLQVPDISAEPEKTMEKVKKLKAGDPDGKKVQMRYHRKKDGTVFPVEITNAIFVSRGREKIIGMLRDITERVRTEETIRRLAYHDALTGLPNRVLFADRLTLAMAHAHRSQRRLAVMSLDLDRFKDVNDTLGHSVGDELLRSVGKRLTGLLRKNDTVSRMGGDEFFLLLSEIARVQDAATIAQKVLQAFQEPFELDGRELNITTSIGVALYPDDEEDADTLLKSADVALYQAKQKGRNNYQLYTSAMDPELQGDE